MFDEIEALKKQNIQLIAEQQNQLKSSRDEHFRFLESMNRVDMVLRKSLDVKEMMSNALQVILELFDVDRAWLLFPCDPEAVSWGVPMEKTKPEYPGAFASGEVLPMDPEMQRVFQNALDAADVVIIDSRDEFSPKQTEIKFSILTWMHITLYPHVGKPWLFGLHQCSFHREWSDWEQDLFREISHRLADALGTVLLLQNLQVSENKFKSLANASTEAIFFSKKGICLGANQTAADMFGWKDPDKFIGGFGTNIIAEESHALVIDHMVNHKSGSYEAIGKRKDNTKFPILIRAKSVPFADEEEVRATLISDLTEQKKLEAEKQQVERQMQHAQKLESLGVLAGGIAHDFNNILMAILGNADLAMLDVSKANPAYTNLKAIEKAAIRAADLSKQMLAYSGKGKFLVEKISVNEAVEEMMHILKVSISKRAVIKYNFAENLPNIEADATQIRQIIMNLVINASDAIDQTSGVISITTGAMDCDEEYLASTYIEEAPAYGQYVYIEVTDTGVGMDKTTQENLFDPFFTTKFTGRGLGLSAVLGIIRSHDGAIKVYSELGKGSSIKVLFPACMDVSNLEKGELRAKLEQSLRPGTVLLVDDEDSVVSVGRKMLERMGFTVITAEDGYEAVKLFREQPEEISLVLLDLIMPHLDGEETFRELRRIKSNVKVLMCSGYNEQEVTQKFAGKPISGFIQKPYTFAKIRKKIGEILG